MGREQQFKNGNVGIGTTSPRGTLHADCAMGGSLKLTRTTAASSNETLGSVSFGNDIDSNWSLITGKQDYATNSSMLTFHTSKDGVGAEQMRIDKNGNVGIGTTEPKSKLHVTGLPEYADNAAAKTGGLTEGAFYRAGDLLKVVH